MGTHGYCGTCASFEGGRCRYFPPAPLMSNSEAPPRWPSVNPTTDWCSHHTPAPADTAQEAKPPDPIPWRIEPAEPPPGIDPEDFVEPEPDPEDDEPPPTHHRRRKAHK